MLVMMFMLMMLMLMKLEQLSTFFAQTNQCVHELSTALSALTQCTVDQWTRTCLSLLFTNGCNLTGVLNPQTFCLTRC